MKRAQLGPILEVIGIKPVVFDVDNFRDGIVAVIPFAKKGYSATNTDDAEGDVMGVEQKHVTVEGGRAGLDVFRRDREEGDSCFASV
jgi:hypothetical protein